MSLQFIWQQMSQRRVASYAPGYDVPYIDGQSLGQGHNGTAAERQQEGYRRRAAVRAPAGLTRSDFPANAMPLHGPLSITYSPVQATGMGFAIPTGNIPASLTFSIALDLWRRKLGGIARRIVVGFNGLGGQSIIEFDRDPTTPGAWGTHIRDNWQRWVAEVLRVGPDARPLVAAILQGEADVGQTPEWYRAHATRSYNDMLADIEAATGIRPPLLIWQTGGYVNSAGHAGGSMLAQLDLVADFNAAFAGPLYPNLTADNTVHPDLDHQILHTEIAAYVWARREQGININLMPGAPIWAGNTVTIPFSVQSGRSLVFDPVDKYAAYGGLVNHGVEVSGTHDIPPYLNDPAATVRGMVVNSVSADALSFTSDGSDTRRAYTFPAPPAGSTVEFDITCSNFVWFRLSDDNGLEPPNEIDLVAAMGAGTRHVSVTIPAYTAQDRLGFLVAENGVNVQISNWRVTKQTEITSVTLSGNAVVVACDAPPTQVQIAMQSGDVTAYAVGGKNYAAHRCDIMESDPEDSLMLPGWSLKRFIPSCRFVRP